MIARPSTESRDGRRTPRLRSAEAEAARLPAGFSLAELLVVIVVTGLIGAGVVGLLVGQNDFYGATEDRTYADVSRRGTADLVTSELRMLSTADLYRATGDTIRARFDLAQAVVCDVDAGTGNVTLVVHHVPDISLPSGRTGTAYSSPFEADFVYADGWTGTFVLEGGTALTTCDANGAPGTLPAERYRIENWSSHPSGLPAVGSVVRYYGDLVYTFRASDLGNGLALWRNDQELVAPFGAGGGFSYIMDDGSEQTTVSSSDFDDIRRVRLSAEAIGDGANRHDVSQDLEVDIAFRN